MKIAAVVLIAISLAGCGEPPATTRTRDQCLRQQIFMACLQNIPKGPNSTVVSNDWSEVIDSCELASFYQSMRQYQHIKPECRP
jgi:hypothetical protein